MRKAGSKSKAVISTFLLALLSNTAAATTWSESVAAKLRVNQTMPRSAELRGVTCVARVKMQVDSNGLIQKYIIVKPCVSPILTRSTDDLLFIIGQVPPPPSRQSTSFEVEVRWPPKG